MNLDNYKNIKKSEWQDLATHFGVQWDSTSVVRYLVEKIAEKIGVDDKIVSDNELKKKVVEKINSEYEVVPVEDSNNEESEETTNDSESKIEELIEENEVEEKSNEIPFSELSRLEQLRLECESYGVAWTEIHTESNLEQVINGVKNAGVQPIKPLPTTINKNTTSSDLVVNAPNTINTNEPFEINSSNVGDVSKAVLNMPNPAINPFAVEQKPIVNGGYQSSNAYLKTYQNIYLNAIRGQFRLLTISEINEMIGRDKHSFSHTINFHPQQQNKIEILLKQNSDVARIPSNSSEWIDING
jgi:hypothetical protein